MVMQTGEVVQNKYGEWVHPNNVAVSERLYESGKSLAPAPAGQGAPLPQAKRTQINPVLLVGGALLAALLLKG